MSFVVHGEASESDEETIVDRPIIYAKAVLGEAEESDDDESDTVDNAAPPPDRPRTLNNNEYFHRKLIESNIQLWRNLNSFVGQVVLSASKQLLNADQLLIKSQVSMQLALSSLKIAHDRVRQIRDKTEDVLTANFIPEINI